ncbi:MAG: phosphoglycerol geranylgeranyltransferase [Chitinophagales bacterium]
MKIDLRRGKRPKVAVLLDPDKLTQSDWPILVEQARDSLLDYFFVGSSLLLGDSFNDLVGWLKNNTTIPVVIFPGNQMQLDTRADALLMLSLISGRNAEYLIGQQVAAAPRIRQMQLPAIPVGYVLIDGGRTATTAYITQTAPIPSDRNDVAVATAMAGELLGLQAIYLEAGSGALQPVPAAMIEAVKRNVTIPVIVGGGLRTADHLTAAANAGADVVVIGNALEGNRELLRQLVL